jgi:hypothetical protein
MLVKNILLLLLLLLLLILLLFIPSSSSSSFPKATRGLEPISYREALLSTLLRAIAEAFAQFAEYTGTGCGSVVVKALFYKSEGRGFETL